ncbi:MAG TPA: wax ester/triacylglycerol synthase family O-acyltransferase [Acidimicrobiales bacterium]|nr:wax ester/triacylglycerol synthase family O-acyltransferase [Acidimicrobiales bacterium]
MALDRLSPLDTSFLDVEDSVNQMHIGSVLILEGPPPPLATFLAMVQGKLPSVPRYRQVMRRVAFEVGRPVWIDDPDFDLDYHVRRAALPAPGRMEEMRELVGDLMGWPLDRQRPLWELWMVEGLEGGLWAVVAKVHHCMVDGVGGAELLSLILDVTPEASPLATEAWCPGPMPSSGDLLMRSVSEISSSSRDVVRRLRPSVASMPNLAQVRELARGVSSAARVVKPMAPSSLNGPIGSSRRWAATSVPVADIKAVRSSLGGGFNDVALAAVTRGFRGLLEKRGECVDRTIRALVPVSVRARDRAGRAIGDGTLANKVSAVFAELPIGLDDPVERLADLSAQMTAAKEANEAQVGESFTSLLRYIPPALLALGVHLFGKAAQRNVNTVTTNIPGPQFPLYAAARRMIRAYPYVPIGMQMRIGVAMLSYDGEVNFGITGDYDHAPDVEVMAEGISLGMDEMLTAAGAAPSIPRSLSLV